MPKVPDDMETHAKFQATAKAQVVERKAMFERLRAERNAKMAEIIKEMCIDLEIPESEISNVHSSFDPNSCYCDCGADPRGPCEHEWTGKEVEMGSYGVSVTCHRCGTTAFNHDMRYAS